MTQQKQEQRFSRRAVWLAVNSEHGERLVEIAREHIRLVKELPPGPPQAMAAAGMDSLADVREIIHARIEQLRAERDAIIQKFEEAEPHADSSRSI